VLLVLASLPAPTLAQADPSASPGPDTTPAPTVPAPSVSFEPAVTLGADTQVFTDTFNREEWGTGEQQRGTISYKDEALVIDVTAEDNSLWSWRSWSDSAPVMRLEGSITFGVGDAGAAYMCGSATPDFLLGGLNRDEWVVGQVVDSRTEVLERGLLPAGFEVATGEPVRVTLECAQTGEGIGRVLLSLEGTLVADVATDDIGEFDRAAVYGRATVVPASMSFDDVTVSVGDSYAPSNELPSPVPSASPTVPPEELASLGADALAFEDDFSDASLWVTGETGGGQVRYDAEQLAIDVTGQNQSLWTWRRLDDESQVVRIEGPVTLNDADGAAGWTCGTAAGAYVIGIANTTEWIVGTIIDGQNAAIKRGPLPDGIDLSEGGTATIALECAWVNPIGAPETRVLMWVDGALVADATAAVAEAFDRVGAYADVGTPAMNARFDDASVLTGEVYAPVTLDEAVEKLAAAVPEAIRDTCIAPPIEPQPGVVATLACIPAGEADRAFYAQFSAPGPMNRTFDQQLDDDDAETPGDSCREQASLTTYTIGGEPAGMLACYTAEGRTRVVWTDSLLWILSAGDDASLGYPEMYDWWLVAGPDR
jgi:hypothetical protein